MKSKSSSLGAIGILTLGSLLVLGAWWYAPDFLTERAGEDLAKRGQYGDQFGALNTLFTGLAFVAVVAAFVMQLVEFRHTLDASQEGKQEEETLKFFEEWFSEEVRLGVGRAWTYLVEKASITGIWKSPNDPEWRDAYRIWSFIV